ncbi:CHAT domain-containing protein [Mycena epipterygia]|nr:CHAT domain-containing protein [Mycena epipterygia]
MRLFAQLILDGNIFLQTVPLESTDNCWKLSLDCKVPQRSHTFVIAIMLHSEARGTRLIGSIKFGRKNVLGSGERKISLNPTVTKVNPDGPLLESVVGFLVSDSDVVNPVNISEMQVSSIGNHLFQMLQATSQGIHSHSMKLWVMHEKILLLSTANKKRANLLGGLAELCLKRWKAYHQPDDLNQAICANEDAVRDDLTSVLCLADLATGLNHRFEQLGNFADLHRSISMQETAILWTPADAPHRVGLLNNLSNYLRLRFEKLSDIEDLTYSVSVMEEVVSLTPNGHPDKPFMLDNLASCLYTRFVQLGDLGDLTRSVLMHQEVLSLTPNSSLHKSLWLNKLGEALHNRFEKLNDIGDLNKAVSVHEDAVSLTPDSNPDKPRRLRDFSVALITRFQHRGNLSDLNKAVSIQEDIVSRFADGNPEKPANLSNLANSLSIRFARLGDIGDVNKSVSMMEAAVSLTANDHPNKPFMFNNLGTCLYTRFEQLGDLRDLSRSVSMQDKALSLTPDMHPNKSLWLRNLSAALTTRFQQLGDIDDLNKSVLIQEEVVFLAVDGSPDKPLILSNLACSLSIRFEKLGDMKDLNRSVTMMQEAVPLYPNDHPDKQRALSNLGSCLSNRFKQLGDLSDLNKAVLLQEEAVTLTPDGHHYKPLMLKSLGLALHTRFEHLNDENDLQQTIVWYTSAAHLTTGAARIRFEAACLWASSAQQANHPSLLDAFHAALDLLPEVAWLGLSINNRHHHIMNAGVVTRNAAAAAIAAGHFEKAVEWLEQGRSIVWGQFLNLRTPVDDLKDKHPELAAELIQLSSQLERIGSDWMVDTSRSQKFHENAQTRAELLKGIRKLEGFEHFLLPKKISELSSAARGGPVVFLNLATTRCDALILRSGHPNRVIHIPLTDFTLYHGVVLTKALEHLISSAGRSERLSGKREGEFTNPQDGFSRILSELWLRIVKPVLDALNIKTPTRDNLQHIWWCPTGLLTFLPIHAAGLYEEDDTFGSKLSDFVISSYAPSLAALMEGFRPQSQSQKLPQLLAVAQPTALGQTPIPGTQKEIDLIQLHARGKLPILRLEQDTATLDSVQRGMLDSRWVHFACHGVQSVSDPTQSALLLAKSERLTLSSIIKLSLPHADFAFLSACQTATGDKQLQEESVHLAAGMLLAGYRGVIATMWSIMDNDAPQVSGDVYEHLLQKSPPDPTRAAEALHLAIRKLRESVGNKAFFNWVPFIHVGV